MTFLCTKKLQVKGGDARCPGTLSLHDPATVLHTLTPIYSHKGKHEAQVWTDDVVGDPLHELRHGHRWHRCRVKYGFLVLLRTQQTDAGGAEVS